MLISEIVDLENDKRVLLDLLSLRNSSSSVLDISRYYMKTSNNFATPVGNILTPREAFEVSSIIDVLEDRIAEAAKIEHHSEVLSQAIDEIRAWLA